MSENVYIYEGKHVHTRLEIYVSMGTVLCTEMHVSGHATPVLDIAYCILHIGY